MLASRRSPVLVVMTCALVSAIAHAGETPAAPAASAPGPSTPAAPAVATVGALAPDFTLKDESGKTHTLSAYRGKTVVLEWTNPGCPYVKRHTEKRTMTTLAEKHAKRGVVWLAIDSTHTNTAEKSRAWRAEKGLVAPTLQDADGVVGRRYGAKTTPHLFVIDGAGVLRYAGAIDDDPQGDAASPKNYVDQALAALAKGETPAEPSTKPYGCSVKYKP